MLYHDTYLKFLRLGNLAWDFFGLIIWSRDFLGFCRVLIFAPCIESSLSLKIRSTPRVIFNTGHNAPQLKDESFGRHDVILLAGFICSYIIKRVNRTFHADSLDLNIFQH